MYIANKQVNITKQFSVQIPALLSRGREFPIKLAILILHSEQISLILHEE